MDWRLVPPLRFPLQLAGIPLSLDLVEVEINGIALRGNNSQALNAIRSLHLLKVAVPGGGRMPIFNRAHRSRMNGPLTVAARRKQKEVGGTRFAPIFQGMIVARECVATPIAEIQGESAEIVDLSFRLKLNVARYISAQEIRRSIRGRRLRPTTPVRLVYPYSEQVEGNEVSYGCDGNVVMGAERLYEYALSKSAIEHLLDLIDALLETVMQHLRNRFEGGGNIVVLRPIFTLQHVEWYAEFAAFDPRRQVSRLFPHLSRQGRRGNVFRRRLTGQVKTFGLHSTAMQIELANGVQSKAYAKTSRRIRFEMKYKRAGLRGAVGSRTRLDRAEFQRKLNLVRLDAQRRITRVFAGLSVETEPSPDLPSMEDLIFNIAGHCSAYEYGEEILRSLRDAGRVTVENGSMLRPSIDALRRAGVLCFIRPQVYSVTDVFVPALRQLMSIPGAALARECRLSATGGSRSGATP